MLFRSIQSVGGEELLSQVLADHRRRVGERVKSLLADRLPTNATIVDKVRELAVIQDAQGYLTDVQLCADGTIRLHERNCAVHSIANGTPVICAAELALFQEILGDEVIRESHIAAGDRCCTYRIGLPDPA